MQTKKLKAALDDAKAKAHRARWAKSTAKAARAKADEARAIYEALPSDALGKAWSDANHACADASIRASWAEDKAEKAQTEAAKAKSKAVKALYRAATKAWEEDEAKRRKGTLTVNNLRAMLEGLPGEAKVLIDIDVMEYAVEARRAWQDDEARAVVLRA